MEQVELKLTEAEILKVNPKPGDILFFKFKGDAFMSGDVDSFGKQLRVFFPDNKVVVVALPEGCDIELTSVRNQAKVEIEASDCSVPTSYCNDCGCGKKERIEGSSGTGGGVKG